MLPNALGNDCPWLGGSMGVAIVNNPPRQNVPEVERDSGEEEYASREEDPARSPDPDSRG